MLDCLILGDSIAKGVSDMRKECVAYVQSGINSSAYLDKYLIKVGNVPAKTVIISLGSNDLKDLDTYESLIALRESVAATQVYWILPNIKETKRKQVWTVANKYGDHVIDARNYDRSQDTVHPTYRGYKEIAKDTK